MAVLSKGDLMGANGKFGNKVYYTANGKTIGNATGTGE